MCQKI